MKISDFIPGDLVKVRGETVHKDQQHDEWIGEVVDTTPEDSLVVSLLERTKFHDGKLWKFMGTESVAPLVSVIKHVVPSRPLTRKSVKKAWRELNFVVGVEDFCLIEDQSSVTLDMHEDDSSDSSSDEDYVPETEEDSDEFTLVSDVEDNDFVAETHRIVHEWNEWSPKGKASKRFKSVVDRIEQRELEKADNRAFSRGEAAPNFRAPKRKRR